MARQMNIEIRLGTLRKVVEKSSSYEQKASQIAEELTEHFKGNRTPQGKQALAAAKAAKKMATAFSRVSEISI
jgi:hypothetical protein